MSDTNKYALITGATNGIGIYRQRSTGAMAVSLPCYKSICSVVF